MAEDDKSNDEQIAALVKALAPALTETISASVSKNVEAQIAGIRAKNDELLKKLAKTADQNSSMAKTVSDLEAEKAKGGNFNPDTATDPITITREQARSVSLYRAAKQAALEKGVRLEVI